VPGCRRGVQARRGRPVRRGDQARRAAGAVLRPAPGGPGGADRLGHRRHGRSRAPGRGQAHCRRAAVPGVRHRAGGRVAGAPRALRASDILAPAEIDVGAASAQDVRRDRPAGAGRRVLREFYLWPFGCHIATVAPVGSVMTLIVPMSPTSITSWTTLAPRSFAFLVDARTSSTPT